MGILRVKRDSPFFIKKELSQQKPIGRASLARENEAGGSWRQEVHILHVNI